jgi:amino acid transporter
MTSRTSGRWRRLLLGGPRDLGDERLFHRLSLIPFLAWVGLGADGLSSSAYGPEEAFKALHGHTYLAVGLAGITAATVLLIAAAYRRIIEEFPTGGGGYVVASKLLGPRVGAVSGVALLVDYVLTITVSIAAAGDALFSFLPPEWAGAKLGAEVAMIAGMVVVNLRGVRESVLLMLPVFLLFLATHAVLIGAGLVAHGATLTATTTELSQGYAAGWHELGLGGMLLLFVRAYSLGGGTYTGIEAVSNGLPIMRDPKVRTAKRTMGYMAVSLAFTATGLLVCYLLWHLEPVPGKTMNAVLVERLSAGVPGGPAFVVATLFSEAMLLVVAAQAGFLDGPRVLANMAIDSWAPHRFAALSERLTAHNGILLMGISALTALLYTGGQVSHLVVMYAINVFLTFSLSMAAMLRFWTRSSLADRPERLRRVGLFATGLVLCLTILVITVIEKFAEGGWITVGITAAVLAGAFVVERHYRRMERRIDDLHRELGDLPTRSAETAPRPFGPGPTAAVLVGSYGGVGIHTLLNLFRSFPGQYRQVVFLSVGVIDSGEFKGEHGLEELRTRTGEMLGRYVRLAHDLGVAAEWRMRVGTDLVAEAERLCEEAARQYPSVTFFAGKLVFGRERWYHRLLHNETAAAIQRRLQWAGRVMVMLPVRVRVVAPVLIALVAARGIAAQATAAHSATRRQPFAFADSTGLDAGWRARCVRPGATGASEPRVPAAAARRAAGARTPAGRTPGAHNAGLRGRWSGSRGKPLASAPR